MVTKEFDCYQNIKHAIRRINAPQFKSEKTDTQMIPFKNPAINCIGVCRLSCKRAAANKPAQMIAILITNDELTLVERLTIKILAMSPPMPVR